MVRLEGLELGIDVLHQSLLVNRVMFERGFCKPIATVVMLGLSHALSFACRWLHRSNERRWQDMVFLVAATIVGMSLGKLAENSRSSLASQAVHKSLRMCRSK